MWRYNYIVNVSGNIVDAVEELGIDQQELQNKLNFTSPMSRKMNDNNIGERKTYFEAIFT
jgi:hypothetical protein